MSSVRAGHRLRYRLKRGFLGPSEAPFTSALNVGVRRDRTRGTAAALAALLAHAFVVLVAVFMPTPLPAPPKKREIPIITAARPPPPPKPEVVPPPPPPRHTQARRLSAPPPPAAAPKLIAQGETLDMEGFSMPVGDSTAPVVGGLVAKNGAGTKPVMEAPPPPPKPRAPPGPPSQAAPPSSRGSDWACPWPDEAQSSGLNDVKVTIRLSINKDGDATDVGVISAPTPSFAEAVKSCALDQHFRPALDDAGNPTAGVVPEFIVHFTR